ncbi:hypothetical protein ACBR40_41335 [Nonomuraea sp. AD125B]|uniref:hypothetical protein n=1 Tax=Nonomuraea sp. AD125B TaxID=3242897 RepID=UPI00352782C2
MSTQPEGGPSGLKPFRSIPAGCTEFVGDSPAIRKELATAVTEMLQYHKSHPSDDNPVYQNCKAELEAIKDMLTTSYLVRAGTLLSLVTKHDGKVQGIAVVSKLGSSLKIDQASVAPWNIVRPAVSEAAAPNPFLGVGWQIVDVGLTYCGVVDLTAATDQSAESFNKMGFLTPEGGPLKGGSVGVLKGDRVEAFKQKMAKFRDK